MCFGWRQQGKFRPQRAQALLDGRKETAGRTEPAEQPFLGPVDTAVAKTQVAVVRHPDLFGRDEQAQIVACLEIVAQCPLAAHGVRFNFAVAECARVAAR